ncbi:hypothetical protein KL86DES1_20913 [uncultured Desulfovibrio sp.]|uniref:Uncharacterized protein n=1 Tax=uncultured Desulfovibrio sp. TaxID=167968 RepID=A0A212L5W2_9BACT|nr:hypothetical protein KL86DES1_20913 [uncultured Desulfovibrio sp.]VZH33818.1 conserved protein of unknown function [Desulfovibrio sp. 86]
MRLIRPYEELFTAAQLFEAGLCRYRYGSRAHDADRPMLRMHMPGIATERTIGKDELYLG